MTAKTKASRGATARRSWWSARRNRSYVWLALLGAGLVAAVALVVSTRSEDGDERSSPASRFPSIHTFETADLHALAFDPGNANRLVFGHHGGVMASDDGGGTWTSLADKASFDGMNLVFDPQQPTTLYIAGHNVFYRSEDGGLTWATVTHNLPGLDLHAFGASATTSSRFYAFAAGRGIFVSEGGASSWQSLWADAPQGTNSIVEMSDGTLLLGASDKGILRSDDGGKTWSQSVSGIETGVIWTVKAQPESGRVYAGTSSGLYASFDGGHNWRTTTLDDVQVVVVGVNPRDPDDVLAIDGGGRLYHSTDGGTSWSS